MLNFNGKTVMVTGGGRNIGRAICLGFARQGAKVGVCDINEENAKNVVKEIEEMGGKAVYAIGDVRDEKAVFASAEKINNELGTIDILVNNAGGSAGLLGKLNFFEDTDMETFDWVMQVNLRGTMLCIKAVLPDMIEKRCGRIVNIASIAGSCGITERLDYSAAKGGIIAMTKALAMEVGSRNITVNCVSPGAIGHGGHIMKGATYLGEDGHGGTHDDIANMVLYLASDEAAYVTGQDFIVDGGRTLGPMSQGRTKH